MPYRRVIPRDLFNEAKLLKCLGRLALIVHDGDGHWPLTLTHEDPKAGFVIDQDPASGDLYCMNLRLYLKNPESRREVRLASPYNSKDDWPLHFTIGENDEANVFDDEGNFSAALLEAIRPH
jgi:hypothetical protein